MSAQLLLVEDDTSIRESVSDFLRGRGYFVTEADCAETAARAIVKGEFSLLLLDVLLPGRSGLDLLRSLRRDGNRVPVIIITARGEEHQRVEGLELGADDYVLKPFSVHELHARVRAVLRRAGSHPSRIMIGEAEVDLEGGLVHRDGDYHRLLQKEADLLSFLFRHAGRTFRREDLLREVWGFDVTPSTRTVDTHVFTLRKKLEASPKRPKHLLTVHGVGYRLVL
ncbi:MAG: DNA-binding response regulator [Planctomycetes bacterium]|nr:DNA-binding response regulator [Planctomycetota bacterium]